MSAARYRTPARMKEAIYGFSVTVAGRDTTAFLPPAADLEETMVLPQENISLNEGALQEPSFPAPGSGSQNIPEKERESERETGPGEEGTSLLSGLSFEDGTTALEGLSDEDGTTVLEGLSFEDRTTVLEGLSDEDGTTVLQTDTDAGGRNLKEEDHIREFDLPVDDFDRTFMPGGLRGLYSRGINDPEAIKKVLDEKKKTREEASAGESLSGSDYEKLAQELDAIKQMLHQVLEQNTEILEKIRQK